MEHLITWMIFTPLIGVLLMATLPERWIRSEVMWRQIALLFSVASSVMGFVLVMSMKSGSPDPQFLEQFNWINSFSIIYEVGVDGLSAFPVLLVSTLFPIFILAEWRLERGFRGMASLFLILQFALSAVVVSQDIFLIFFFFAIIPLPVYFLISAWGDKESSGAGFNYVASSSIGLSLFLAAVILIYAGTDLGTFSIRELTGEKLAAATVQLFGQSFSVSHLAFALISIGFGLQAPVWPFHGWYMRVADSARPTVIALILGVIYPVIIFVFIKLAYSLFPLSLGRFASVIIAVGLVNLLVPAISVITQKTLRRVVVTTHLSLGGLVILGVGSLSASGLMGALYHLMSTGSAMATLILLVGFIERTFQIKDLDVLEAEDKLLGLIWSAPVLSVCAAVFLVSLLGFPGVGGFIGSAFIFIGSFNIHPMMVLVCAVALIFVSYRVFSVYRRVFFGQKSEVLPVKGLIPDLGLLERAYIFPVVLGLIALGVYPKPLLEVIRPTALTLLSMVK